MSERYRIAGALASPFFFAAIYMSVVGEFWRAGLPCLLVGLFLYFSPELFDLTESTHDHD